MNQQSYTTSFGIRHIDDVIGIAPAVIAQMDWFVSVRPEAADFCDDDLAHLRYLTEHLRPFGQLIQNCIPAAAQGPRDLPEGRSEFLRPYVTVYIERAALLHSIADARSKAAKVVPFLSSSVIWALSLANKFDYMILRPTGPYSQATREILIGRVNAASTLANARREDGDPIDVPIDAFISGFPRVPSWTQSQIAVIRSKLAVDAWACEMACLQDQIEASERFTSALANELVILWINRARHLAQCIHHIANIANEEFTPPSATALIRDAIAILLRNMAALGKASFTYGGPAGVARPDFFIPGKGTALFGMAERFVDLFGFHGDGSPLQRAMVFENLTTLHQSMVLDPSYSSYGIDFPGFLLPDASLRWYGICDFIKGHQAARLAGALPADRHNFGDRLRRYNPELPSSEWYTFPDFSGGAAPTRPNSPSSDSPTLRCTYAVASLGISVVEASAVKAPSSVEVEMGDAAVALVELSLAETQSPPASS
ncbi:hypothetical protein C8R46DRAFT_1225992 [Mycena filopes]|nr:hypothetical protein C8R46DRAFT_1225992 [Mycena filopes]